MLIEMMKFSRDYSKVEIDFLHEDYPI